MKFAKELETDLVPEWKAKYLNYKEAKKRLKAVGRAYKKLNATPKSGFQRITPGGRSPADTLQQFSFGGATSRPQEQKSKDGEPARKGVRFFSEQTQTGQDRGAEGETAPINIAKTRTNDSAGSRLTRYGSIIGTPPNDSVAPAPSEEGGAPPSLLLPDPALQPTDTNTSSGHATRRSQDTTSANNVGDAYQAPGPPAAGSRTSQAQFSPNPATRHMSLFRPRSQRAASTPGPLQRTLSRRIMSMGGSMTPPPGRSPDVELASYRDFDFRQAEFFDYLDKELDKIDTFYREKEEEAVARMKVLREQLHILRDRRLEDLARARKSSAMRHSTTYGAVDVAPGEDTEDDKHSSRMPWQRLFGEAKTIAHGGRVGKGTKAMEGLATPSQANLGIDNSRDYTRRKSRHDIPYRTAKRKLKIAMQEFYRGLELLKSFALLNRTGFRKINKKYDKTVNAKPSYKYMSDKVNRSGFVQSDIVDDLIRTVEDLYARYFERGNHKIAAGKLRAKAANAGDYTGSVFRTGAYLATGLVFGIQGLVYGSEKLFDPNPEIAVQTSYLLQVHMRVPHGIEQYNAYQLTALRRILSHAPARAGFLSCVSILDVLEDQLRIRVRIRYPPPSELAANIRGAYVKNLTVALANHIPASVLLLAPLRSLHVAKLHRLWRTGHVPLLPGAAHWHHPRTSILSPRPYIPTHALMVPIFELAPSPRRSISCGVPRFLPRRHVLQSDIRDGQH